MAKKIKDGAKGVLVKDVLTPNGVIYKNTKIKIDEIRKIDNIRVSDMAGRIFWVKQSDILIM